MKSFNPDAPSSPRRWALLPLLALLHLAIGLELELELGLELAAHKRLSNPMLETTERIEMRLLAAKKHGAQELEPPLPRLSPRFAPSLAPRMAPPQRTSGMAAQPAPSLGISASNSGAEPAALSLAKELQPSLLEPGTTKRLKLGLPARPASAAQPTPAQMAALDSRGNSQRPDMGERMAVALGSDPSLREEIIAAGHRRFRQGSSCTDVNDTRNSQLNPFDENARMGAKLMSKCKE